MDVTSDAQSQSAAITTSPDTTHIHGCVPDGRAKAQASIESTTNADSDSTAERQMPKRTIETWNAGIARMGAKTRARQTRLNTSVPLVPPKPKLFFTAYSIFISRAVLAQ